MPRWKKDKSMVMEQMNICLPKVIIKDLKALPNCSEAIRYLIEENLDRLLEGGVTEAVQLRKKIIEDIVIETFKKNISNFTEEIYNDLQKQFDEQLSIIEKHKKELLSELKKSRNTSMEYKKKLTEIEYNLKKLETPVKSSKRKLRNHLRIQMKKALKEICDKSIDKLLK